MKLDERSEDRLSAPLDQPLDGSSDLPGNGEGTPVGDTGWRLWPPSPKMQIAMIALGFGLFNLILIAIWAIVMVYRF